MIGGGDFSRISFRIVRAGRSANPMKSLECLIGPVDQGDCTIFSPPSPASLGPYLAIVQEARANLAARGGPVRSGDVERLAFHLLKERNLPHD